MSSPHQLDVVMYHFVRPIAESRWPGIKGLEAAAFDTQLDYLEATYDVLTPREAIAALRGDRPLARRSCLLTFDDGYKDHFTHVFPRLEERNLKAIFFPPACAAMDRKLLDVNKIHFILASGAAPDQLGRLIDDAVRANGALQDPDFYRAEHHRDSGYDTADVIYVKRMLQHALPEDMRSMLTDDLFAETVSRDQKSFADELYCSVEELQQMYEAGHMIGSHGDAHVWLNRKNAEDQRADIFNSLRLFEAIGMPDSSFTFCYPYGGYNEETLRCLEALCCAAAFTTSVASATPGSDSLLEIPRLDTNAFPPRAEAAPFAITA